MKILIKLFDPPASRHESVPRFEGELIVHSRSVVEQEIDAQDLKFLWDVERAINEHVAGRCHIEVVE